MRTPKRTIRTNRWGNTSGYVSGRRVAEFGLAIDEAEFWRDTGLVSPACDLNYVGAPESPAGIIAGDCPTAAFWRVNSERFLRWREGAVCEG